ncbi:hypothetical protein H6P81_015601 [Aristolochia fimbriata]|uniref:Pentatricopeptide repeat-containing protein n=1 Tax=Aristolochia fimbriata TaxID=158543 RepID=A0AAV7E793_ARIFI|nr:hypothetical protein H6P81_015601 [Aristolochia fimbriata]
MNIWMRLFSSFPIHGCVRRLKCKNISEVLVLKRNFVAPCLQVSWDDFSAFEDRGDSFGKIRLANGKILGDINKKLLRLEGGKEEQNAAKKIISILSERGWKIDFSDGIVIELDDVNVTRMLNDLFGESSNAALAYYFFKWSEKSSGSRHGVFSMCTMVNIAVSGNLNHIAMKILHYLITINSGDSHWHNLMFGIIRLTCKDRQVLETVCSMLVSSYVKENMIDLALKFLNLMKPLKVFPSTVVYKYLLKALLKSNQMKLAWDVFEEMHCHNNGTIFMMSLFIHDYCAKGNVTCASKLLFEMKKHGYEADIVSYTMLIKALCKISLLKEATVLFFKIIQLGMHPDPASITSLIDNYCKSGKLTEAMDILEISVIYSSVLAAQRKGLSTSFHVNDRCL